jgi:hypothetical protein
VARGPALGGILGKKHRSGLALSLEASTGFRRISEWISFPADAFSAAISRQRRDFRATSLLFSRKETRKSEGGQAAFMIDRR